MRVTKHVPWFLCAKLAKLSDEGLYTVVFFSKNNITWGSLSIQQKPPTSQMSRCFFPVSWRHLPDIWKNVVELVLISRAGESKQRWGGGNLKLWNRQKPGDSVVWFGVSANNGRACFFFYWVMLLKEYFMVRGYKEKGKTYLKLCETTWLVNLYGGRAWLWESFLATDSDSSPGAKDRPAGFVPWIHQEFDGNFGRLFWRVGSLQT